MRRKNLFRRSAAVVLSGVMIASMIPMEGLAVGAMFTPVKQIAGVTTDKVISPSSQFINGYIDLGIEIPSVNVDNGLQKAPVLEEKYSSVDKGYVTSVKSQGNLGTCWSYAAVAAMESYVLSHGMAAKTTENPDGVNFSEFALAYTVFSDDLYFAQTGDKTTTTDMLDNLNSGGNGEYAFKALTKWAGVVNDTTDKNSYSNGEEYEVDFSDISYILTGQYYINMTDVDRVKAEIVENGAVASSYFSDDMYTNDGEGFYHYYIYNYGTSGTNHAITIVGWDDTISKEKFAHTVNNVTYKPSVDGAWLIKNSWGSSYGDGGYMWISYDDVSIKNSTAVVYEVAPKETYDKNYQHDGATIFSAYYDTYKKYANVFTVDGEKTEVLKAVSFALSSVNETYSIQIYKNPTEDEPESGEAMLTTPVTGTTSYAGYYTVPLNETIELEDGDTFAVVIEFEDNVNMIISMPEMQIGGGNVKAVTYSTAEENQSYIIDDSNGYEWIYDLDNGGYNACIKAFTSEVTNQGDLEIPEITSVEQTAVNKVKIAWQKVTGAECYYLYRSEVIDSGYELIAGENDDLTVNEYTDTVEYGKTYYYKIKAANAYVESDFSQPKKHMTSVPEVTIKYVLEDGVVTIGWDAVEDVDGYKVYRSENGSYYTQVGDVTAESDKTEYSETVEKYNKNYYYKVVVYVGVDEEIKTSIDSNVINVVKKVPVVRMTQLNNLFYNETILKWDPVEGIDGYLIYRRDADTLFSVIAELDADAVSYVDDISEYEKGDQVSYYVSAYVLQDEEKEGNNPEGNGYAITVKDKPLKFKWYVDAIGRLTIFWDSYMDGYKYISYIDDVQSEEFGTAFTTEPDTCIKNFFSSLYNPENTYYVRLAAMSLFNEVKTAYQKEALKVGGAWVEPVIKYIDDVYAAVDADVVLSAVIENSLENFDYKYQWYVAEDEESEGLAIEGATESTYTVDSSAEGKKYYYCKISAKYIDDYEYITSNMTGKHTKVLIGNVKSFTVESIGDRTYTGNEIKANVIVKDGETVLTQDVDYTLTYSEDLTNVGTVSVLVQGMGIYEYSIRVTYDIVPRDISDSAELNIEQIEDVVYTGSEVTIDNKELIIKDGRLLLTEGTDYDISYENNKNVGKAAVIITFKGNYTGEKKLEFDILQKDVNEDNSVSVSDVEDKEYTGSAITVDEEELIVKYGDIELVAGTDYDIAYSDDVINVGKVTLTLTFKGNYTGTKTVEFDILPKDVSYDENVIINAIESQTFTGEEITIDDALIILKYGEYTFINGTDYDVSYLNNINAGTATIVFTFTGNYKGIRTIQFGIMPKDIEDEITIEDIEDQEHTGEEVKPSLVVKYGEKLLVEGTDYDVEYGDNIEAGQATAKVILKGNYTGSVQVTFEIVITIPSKITSPSISVDDESAVLSKITAGTKISELLNKLNEKRYLQVRKGSSVVTDDILVGTGMTVCIMNNTLIKKQYTVVVTGDVNGDGKISITDMISVKSHILGKTKLNGVYGSAADTNGDANVSITDFIRVKAHILGKSTISGITAN